MSRIKWNLTKIERSAYKEVAERLVAGGADLDLSGFAQTNAPRLEITQVPEMLASYAGASAWGFHYVVDVRIVALAENVVIEGFDLSSPAWDLGTYLLVDPTVRRPGDLLYRLGDGTTFPRDQVLNHYLDKQRTLRRGEVMEGVLLFGSFVAIPKHYLQRGVMSATLSVWDQFGEIQESDIELHVDRSAEWVARRPPRRTSLFQKSDEAMAPPDRSIVVPIPGADGDVLVGRK